MIVTDELKQQIIDSINNENCNQYVYLEQEDGAIALKGNYSDDVGLKFMKVMAIERPAVYRQFKKWDGKPPRKPLVKPTE